jgi:hypothetical protein
MVSQLFRYTGRVFSLCPSITSRCVPCFYKFFDCSLKCWFPNKGFYFFNYCSWEDIKAIAEVALMIIVGFATDGLALISKIVLIVDIAIDLADKIANLVMFSDMKKTMK